MTVERNGEVCRYRLREQEIGHIIVSVTRCRTSPQPSRFDHCIEDGDVEEHPYTVARSGAGTSQVAVAFPMAGAAPAAAPVSTTLPLSNFSGLRTPLNAQFDLTANREALMEGSERNARLRDELAELWLATVAKSAPRTALADSSDSLSMRAWLLQPGTELAKIPFWAPFVQRVRSGLQEVPLVPVEDTDMLKNRLLPISRCRRPDSPLLRLLHLTAGDVALLGLGIPVEKYLQQLPAGTDVNMSEFNTCDLLELLSLPLESQGAEGCRFESRGLSWRKDVVKALAKRCHEVDLTALRKAPLFVLGRGEPQDALDAKSRETKKEPKDTARSPSFAKTWMACGDDPIFGSVPKGSPALLRVLDKACACQADKDLLKLLGCGGRATHRDVAYAIVQQTVGLTETEDHWGTCRTPCILVVSTFRAFTVATLTDLGAWGGSSQGSPLLMDESRLLRATLAGHLGKFSQRDMACTSEPAGDGRLDEKSPGAFLHESSARCPGAGKSLSIGLQASNAWLRPQPSSQRSAECKWLQSTALVGACVPSPGSTNFESRAAEATQRHFYQSEHLH